MNHNSYIRPQNCEKVILASIKSFFFKLFSSKTTHWKFLRAGQSVYSKNHFTLAICVHEIGVKLDNDGAPWCHRPGTGKKFKRMGSLSNLVDTHEISGKLFRAAAIAFSPDLLKCWIRKPNNDKSVKPCYVFTFFIADFRTQKKTKFAEQNFNCRQNLWNPSLHV